MADSIVRYLVYCILMISAAFISFLLVPVAKKLAFRWKVIDNPGHRKIHAAPKPYLGGAAIFLSFFSVIILSLIAVFVVQNQEAYVSIASYVAGRIDLLRNALPKLWAILGAGTIIFILGIIDDIKGENFPPKLKLAGQIVAALIVIGNGVITQFLPFDWMDWLFSIIWIVGITNSFNLLDNMDGLSSGVAAISAAVFFLVAVLQGQLFIAMILSVFIGSILGFLKYNYNPASIFMGDAGSMFLGFMLGSLTISTSYVTNSSTSLLPVLMPLVILSIPIFDTISVIIIRLKEHRPIYVGDKRHLSHRLVDMGFSPRSAVNLIYLLTLAIGLVAVILPELSLTNSLLVFIQVLIILIIVSVLMFVGRRTSKKQE